MNKKLHVTHLDLATEDIELNCLFSEAGVVRRAQVMACRRLGSSTTTGLVEMDSDQQSAVAIAMLNGRSHRGHILVVDWATDAEHPVMFESMNTHEEPGTDS